MSATAKQLEVKERPIIFSSAMVNAILEGRKTQTRRVLKSRWFELSEETGHLRYTEYDPPRWHHGEADSEGRYLAGSGPFDPLKESDQQHAATFCPYGNKGDRLWVRETWRRASGLTIYYKADEPENAGAGWKSPIHMPFRFSRLKLEVKNIRVERLRAITEADAKAEGVLYYGDLDPAQTDYKNYQYNDKYGDDWGVATARESYRSAWQMINAKRGYSWESNPFVWVIEFKKL